MTIPSYDGTFKIADITVSLTAAFPTDSGLTAVLIAPDGTQVPLFSGVGGTGSNFENTVFDDAAENSITTGSAPFTGSVSAHGYAFDAWTAMTVDVRTPPAQTRGSPVTWTLKLTNSLPGATGMLDNWSLNITPVISVAPVSPVNGAATRVHHWLPAPAAQRHLHDPARSEHPGHVRRRDSTPIRMQALTC